MISSNQNMEKCQHDLGLVVGQLLSQQITPIVLGGGHDVALGHYLGIEGFLRGQSRTRLGIVNFDAHFDLRPVVDSGNSGTPFFQILKRENIEVHYLPIGIQSSANTIELFVTADSLGVSYLTAEDCRRLGRHGVKEELQSLIEQVDHVYCTIDLDEVSSAYAPGVSAPSPLGLNPWYIIETISYLKESDKVIGWDIAEMNPKFDLDNMTARLAARLVDAILL